MQCPLLKGKHTRQCGGVRATVVLSGTELEKYCLSGDHYQCPVFMAWEMRKGEQLDIVDYCSVSGGPKKKPAANGEAET